MSARPLPPAASEFLPALLEITDTPPSPAGRAVMTALLALLATAIGWACLAEVSIVATAPGVVLAPGRSRPVQAFESGRVRALRVSEGQRVQAGQIVLELEPTVAKADVRMAEQQLLRTEQVAPIARERTQAAQRLLDGGLLSRLDFLAVLERQAGAEQELSAARDQLRKVRERLAWQSLRSPVSGTVQQLAVRSVGDVVQGGGTVMLVVPEGEGLEVEAQLANRDRGFVAAGQRAVVKFETFPFTRFGALRGTVTGVSADAITDPQRGPQFIARVRLEDPVLRVGADEYRVLPGMAATVDVDTGTRRIVEFFLAPLLQHGAESLRER